MSSRKSYRPRNTGFSMVEIMVGVAIGLLSILVVMQIFSSFEGQKRTTTSGADAQTNGGISLYSIERDLRMAGYGLGNAAGCSLSSAFGGATLPQLTLAPVSITNGANGLLDTVTILSSNKSSWSVPAKVISNHLQTDTQFNTDAPVGMAQNDLLVAYESIANVPTCTLLQVSNANPVINPILHTTGNWNGSTAIFPATYTTSAELMNLGSLLSHTYSLDASNNLTLGDYSSASNTSKLQTIAPEIVNLQAEYGFDTRTGTRTDARVDTWNGNMIDADGSGIAGDAGDIQRIYAVRLAIVARSGLKEKPLADGTCNITTANPSWAGGSIDVSKNPDGTANADWQCYRYKTFETVAPLRNLIWR